MESWKHGHGKQIKRSANIRKTSQITRHATRGFIHRSPSFTCCCSDVGVRPSFEYQTLALGQSAVGRRSGRADVMLSSVNRRSSEAGTADALPTSPLASSFRHPHFGPISSVYKQQPQLPLSAACRGMEFPHIGQHCRVASCKQLGSFSLRLFADCLPVRLLVTSRLLAHQVRRVPAHLLQGSLPVQQALV